MRWVILDTSYLLEMYRIPGKHAAAAHAMILGKLQTHVAAAGRLYVPIPVIFEFANHIAAVTDGAARFQLAGNLRETVTSSVQTQSPWVVLPFRQNQLLDEVVVALTTYCESFATQYAIRGVGLTDVAIIDAARQLRRPAARQSPRATVHIWTRDAVLKAEEPDHEPDPYV
jgi:hypothetical protein